MVVLPCLQTLLALAVPVSYPHSAVQLPSSKGCAPCAPTHLPLPLISLSLHIFPLVASECMFWTFFFFHQSQFTRFHGHSISQPAFSLSLWFVVFSSSRLSNWIVCFPSWALLLNSPAIFLLVVCLLKNWSYHLDALARTLLLFTCSFPKLARAYLPSNSKGFCSSFSLLSPA